MTSVKAYTDGACKANGKGLSRVGWGFVMYVDFPETDERPAVSFVAEDFAGKAPTTNNEMELTALLRCLQSIPSNSNVELYLDSEYVLKGIVSNKGYMVGGKLTGWAVGWRKKGWITAGGKPVANLKLWKTIISLIETMVSEGVTFSWFWVRGHQGDEGNERADELANLGAESLIKK